jgi:hypothetical protein
MDKNLADGTHASNLGTAGTGVTATEYGNGQIHLTKLVLSGVALTIGDNAALADGAIIYTFPAGAYQVLGASASVGVSLTTGTPTTDTPEVGLGSLIASGVQATLGAVNAACEDIAGPAVADDIAGTAELFGSGAGKYFAAADSHVLHFNVADTWADVDDTAATADGTVWVSWAFYGD